MTHPLAVPPDRAIDVAIAERVMGHRWYVSDATGRRALFVPDSQPGWFVRFAAGDESLASDWDGSIERYSTDVDAAFRVVAKLASEVHWAIRSPFTARCEWFAGVTPLGVTGWNGRPDVDEPGATVTEAICKAALAWVDGRKQREEDAR